MGGGGQAWWRHRRVGDRERRVLRSGRSWGQREGKRKGEERGGKGAPPSAGELRYGHLLNSDISFSLFLLSSCCESILLCHWACWLLLWHHSFRTPCATIPCNFHVNTHQHPCSSLPHPRSFPSSMGGSPPGATRMLSPPPPRPKAAPPPLHVPLDSPTIATLPIRSPPPEKEARQSTS